MISAAGAMGRLLLHTCCGPCSTFVARWFAQAGYEVIGFFYNPNIHPYEEYQKRKAAAESWAEAVGVTLITSTAYDPENWIVAVGADIAERCTACYRLRLVPAARKARELKCVAFSTTLLISPYQQHDNIRTVGEQVSEESGVPFLYRDFRPDFRQTYQLSRSLDLYRQNYCGCILSDQDRVARLAAKRKSVN
ncbi:MAG TPA: epoxyqueuosine reductase QueH [Bacillota bacterium]|nr:epoxyqueuosine reductase QueH [Bacillota bacterium]